MAGKGEETRTLLEGEWAMTSAVFSGVPMDESLVAWCNRITHGNHTRVVAGPQTFVDATFELNFSPQVHEIEYLNLGGANKGKRQLGVFSLEDDVLRICMAAPGKSRPAQFISKKGDGRSLTIWRRKP